MQKNHNWIFKEKYKKNNNKDKVLQELIWLLLRIYQIQILRNKFNHNYNRNHNKFNLLLNFHNLLNSTYHLFNNK